VLLNHSHFPNLHYACCLLVCTQLEIAKEENKRLQGMLNDVKAENKRFHDALSSIHQTTKVI
jgi:hypothetical protein